MDAESPPFAISRVFDAPGIRTDLELLDERRFDNGVSHLRYRIPT